ncbi:MAG TPA: hypothetical protein VH277_19850 [Gemmatimonadaceae bacterium]|jgi:hypothetical protein|nr:hypothetical protein [Gemmatimonadaceae bacterium]
MVVKLSRIAIAGALGITFVLDACARMQSTHADGVEESDAVRSAITFDNESGAYVDVYLLTEQRQWWLGRVAQGGRATLRLPAAELGETPTFVRLAVLAGRPRSLQVSREPNALFSISQLLSALMSQRWSFSQTESTTARLLSTELPP